MREIKWAFSFLGKSKYKLFAAYLMTIIVDIIMVIDPQIISRIVNTVLYPMFDDRSIPTETVLRQLVPLLLIAFGLLILRSVIRFVGNLFR